MHPKSLNEEILPIVMSNFEGAEPQDPDFVMGSSSWLLERGVIVREVRDELLEILLTLLLELNYTLLDPRLL